MHPGTRRTSKSEQSHLKPINDASTPQYGDDDRSCSESPLHGDTDQDAGSGQQDWEMSRVALNQTPPDAPSKPDVPTLVIDTNDVDTVFAPRQIESPSYERSSFNDLPNEIILQILSKLLPLELDAISLVSHRFYELATTRHAWRSAFTSYFSPTCDLRPHSSGLDAVGNHAAQNFTRLTAHASWRGEYTLRIRLLRALERGKPTTSDASPASPRGPVSASPGPLNDYDSRNYSTVDTLHANFRDSHVGKQLLQSVHASSGDGTTSSSYPVTGVITANSRRTYRQFFDSELTESMYGLGVGNVIGVPNSMAVSALYGTVFGSGIPGHADCWWTDISHTQKVHLDHSKLQEASAPKLPVETEVTTCIWIAKSATIPMMSSGLLWVLTGASSGVISGFSLGTGTEAIISTPEIGRTVCWALSPGVPIVSITVDEHYTDARRMAGRPWACALNALGEVFVLARLPNRGSLGQPRKPSLNTASPWAVGRLSRWKLIEATRRMPRPCPYEDLQQNVCSSLDHAGSSDKEALQEVQQAEAYFAKPPKWFKQLYTGWDMQRRLEVDFAGSNEEDAAESVIVIETGLAGERGCSARVMRYTRFVPLDQAAGNYGPVSETAEEWRSSRLTCEPLRGLRITSSALDDSLHATTIVAEDPMLDSDSQAATLSGVRHVDTNLGQLVDIPGRRARYLAIGTKTGIVIAWDVRDKLPSTSTTPANRVAPVKIIHTDSPEITCVAVSALAIFHGGNDGLVQAWNPLGANQQPVRTLNSRFSSRARRRLLQVDPLSLGPGPDGVGGNHFAAGAICIDPDPTILQGVVSIGTRLRFWRFSTSSADQYKSQKRRVRRLERGSNSAADHRSVPDSHGNVLKFMENERSALEADEANQWREAARLARRYGTELLGEDASEEQLLAYATLLSQESHAQEVESRHTTPVTTSAQTNLRTSKSAVETSSNDGEVDDDVAEAIRQSLALHEQESANMAAGPSAASTRPDSTGVDEDADLDLAIRLAIADGQEWETAEPFPALHSRSSAKARGKRRE